MLQILHKNGANEQIRTADLNITNVVRYLLRHVSIGERALSVLLKLCNIFI